MRKATRLKKIKNKESKPIPSKKIIMIPFFFTKESIPDSLFMSNHVVSAAESAGLRHQNSVISQSSVSIIQIGRSQESIASQH